MTCDSRGEQRALQAEMDETKQFLSQHQVDPVDVALLEAPALDGNDDAMTVFFDVLSRVDGIKSNCKRLVEANPGPTRYVSIDWIHSVHLYYLFLASSSSTASASIKMRRTTSCTNGRCSIAAAPRPSPVACCITPCATSSPALPFTRTVLMLVATKMMGTMTFRHCKEALVAARRGAILRRFIIALTRGGPNGIPRPIEIHSHDPVRYAGDMLAWVHAAIASEHEYFKVRALDTSKGSSDVP